MSRIGKKPVSIPKGVTVKLDGNNISIKGPKGELFHEIPSSISVELKDSELIVTRPNDLKQNKALHGLTRVLLHNMVVGVSEGYSKTLDLVGVGYRVELKGEDRKSVV